MGQRDDVPVLRSRAHGVLMRLDSVHILAARSGQESTRRLSYCVCNLRYRWQESEVEFHQEGPYQAFFEYVSDADQDLPSATAAMQRRVPRMIIAIDSHLKYSFINPTECLNKSYQNELGVMGVTFLKLSSSTRRYALVSQVSLTLASREI